MNLKLSYGLKWGMFLGYNPLPTADIEAGETEAWEEGNQILDMFIDDHMEELREEREQQMQQERK